MHASAVWAVFCLLLLVLSFVTDHAHQYIYVSVLWSSTSRFLPVNLKIILRNVTSRKNSDVQLQNSNLKLGIMSISYMSSNFREKQLINGQDPAEQVYKIWRKNFQELLSNHIFGVGSFFKPHPVDCLQQVLTKPAANGSINNAYIGNTVPAFQVSQSENRSDIELLCAKKHLLQ